MCLAPGEGLLRNVRSDMLPVLGERLKPSALCLPAAMPPREEANVAAPALLTLPNDPLRCMRFVCRSPTYVGSAVWDRNAAAAAAADRTASFLFWFARKARPAADAASDEGVEVAWCDRGCCGRC